MRGRASRLLAPPRNAPPVQVDERGAARWMGAMAVEVEQVRSAGVAVAEVGHPLDLTGAGRERPAQDASPPEPAAQPSGHAGVDAGAPASPEALGQCALDRRAGPQPPPGDDHEPDRRQHGQTERRPPPRRAEITLAGGQQRRGEEPVAGDEWQLVGQVAEPEAQVRRAGPARPRRRHSEQHAPRHERHRHHVPNRHGRHSTGDAVGAVSRDPVNRRGRGRREAVAVQQPERWNAHGLANSSLDVTFRRDYCANRIRRGRGHGTPE